MNDAFRRLRNLQASAESWHERADDLPKLADVVWSAGDRVAALERDARPRMAAARDVGLRCRLVLEVRLCSVNTVNTLEFEGTSWRKECFINVEKSRGGLALIICF